MFHADSEFANPPPQAVPERVLLVHGLAAHRSCLWLLAHRLRQRGYDPRVWGYPSVLHGVRRHARRLEARFRELEAEPHSGPIHLVVHSMGGILTRLMLDGYRPDRLGRVVMLGTPNRGSHVARRLSPWLSWGCRPLGEISDADESPVHRFPALNGVDFGVIAGTRDRVVRVEATHLAGQRDHCTVPSGHGEMLFRRDVVERIDWFLSHGQFAAQANHRGAEARSSAAEPPTHASAST